MVTAGVPVREDSPRPRAPVLGSSPGPGDERPRILLVEDSPEYALLVETMLAEAFEDVEATHCTSLSAAAETLAEGEFDCAVVDLSLPDAGELEAVRRLRELAPQLPIVVLSGQDSESLAVQALGEGAQDYLVKRHAEGHLLGRAIRYAGERMQAELELSHRALHDGLTGLPNRALFMHRLSPALSRARDAGACLAVLFVDLDRFKVVNDSLGHAVGDRLLVEVSERLVRALRPGDLVARFGGDEFIVLCEEVSSESDAMKVAARVSASLSEAIQLDGNELWVGASIGVAVSRGGADTGESLIREADQAMYKVKQGGARCELADGATTRHGAPRAGIELELGRALKEGELELHYQPQFDVREKRLFGVEALLRWRHPRHGMVAPGQFIAAAEQGSLIVPIGRWVLRTACTQLARWREAGSWPDGAMVSVNLSLRQLSDPDVVAVVAGAVEQAGMRPDELCLEVTESVLGGQIAATAARLEELKALGVVLSLDDFGTGVSSLAALDGYPVDMVKIDRTFAGPLDVGLQGRRVFAAVLGVGRAMGLRTVAEGIERPGQLVAVGELGADIVQGYLTGRPVPAARLPAALEPVAELDAL